MTAGHRFIRQVAGLYKVKMSFQDCYRVQQVFERYGGSWVGLFRGSVTEVRKLKRVIQTLKKRGLIGQGTNQQRDSKSPAEAPTASAGDQSIC